MSDHGVSNTMLLVPRGSLGLEPLKLDMTGIYQAEGRLRDIAYVTPATASELQATYNVAANDVGKYLSWVKYEQLRGKKELGKAKSRVLLDELPAKAKELKEIGVKPNEDFRDALFARDQQCSDIQDRLDAMEAVYALLEGKFWSFVRAFNAAGGNAHTKGAAPSQSFNAVPGQLETSEGGFMGKPRY